MLESLGGVSLQSRLRRSTRTVPPMLGLRDASKNTRRHNTAVNMFLVHQAPAVEHRTEAVAPGVRALNWRAFLGQL